MLTLPRTLILFDTEYTAWEGSQARRWSAPHEFREIVQIGAIRIDTDTFEELSSFETLILPIKNPLLSDYFIALTGITQDDVDAHGKSLEEALSEFSAWAGNDELYSFGWDVDHIINNTKFNGISFPFDAHKFHDVRSVFEDEGISTKGYMSSTIPEAFGEKNPSVSHNALYDARSIAVALHALSRLRK